MDNWQNFKLRMEDIFRKPVYQLDEYPLLDGEKHPFAMICPGGGYAIISNAMEGAPIAKKLNERGYAAFVLRYRCRQQAHFPAPMDDLARALRDVLSRQQELGIKAEHYSVWGASAGGHLAATFGTCSMGWEHYHLPRPEALILSYPVITMGKEGHAETRKNLLGTNPDQAMIEQTSVEKQITKAYPATFIWYGKADTEVSPKNSLLLKAELDKKNIANRLIAYDHVGHGVGLGENTECARWFDEAVQFWKDVS